jgi:hypothetical protein
VSVRHECKGRIFARDREGGGGYLGDCAEENCSLGATPPHVCDTVVDRRSKHLITIARDKHEGEAGETKRGTERNDLVDLAVVMGRPPRPIFLRQVVMSDKGSGQGICYRKSDLCGDRV